MSCAQSYEPPVAFSYNPNPITAPPSTEYSTTIEVSDVDLNASNQQVNHTDKIPVAVHQINSGTSNGAITLIQTGTVYKYSHSKTSHSTPDTYTDYYKFKDNDGYALWNDTNSNWSTPVGQIVEVGNGQGGSEGGGGG